MKRLLMISFALVVPVVGMVPAPKQKPRQQHNRPPSIESFMSSLTRVEICPWRSDKPEVQLVVNATDPDGDSLSYEYSITEGSISGKGKSVLWSLRGLPRGPHEVRVTVTDGKAGKANAALTVTTIDASICDPPPPPCPVIKVSCPDELHKSKIFTFSAVIEPGAKSYTAPAFYWKLNAGRIVNGQDTREIEATTTGANGFEKITATVNVGGFDPSCATTTVSCSTKIIW